MVINVNDNKSLHFLHGMQIFEKKKKHFLLFKYEINKYSAALSLKTVKSEDTVHDIIKSNKLME